MAAEHKSDFELTKQVPYLAIHVWIDNDPRCPWIWALHVKQYFELLSPGVCASSFDISSEHMLRVGFMSTSCEIVVKYSETCL